MSKSLQYVLMEFHHSALLGDNLPLNSLALGYGKEQTHTFKTLESPLTQLPLPASEFGEAISAYKFILQPMRYPWLAIAPYTRLVYGAWREWNLCSFRFQLRLFGATGRIAFSAKLFEQVWYCCRTFSYQLFVSYDSLYSL